MTLSTSGDRGGYRAERPRRGDVRPMLTEVLVLDPIGRRTMDAPSDATMGSPLLVPFDGSAHAESVLPYLALLADGDREVILLQVVPEAQSVSSPMGDVMLSANELRQATETAARADLDRAAAQAGLSRAILADRATRGDRRSFAADIGGSDPPQSAGDRPFESRHQRDRAWRVRNSGRSSRRPWRPFPSWSSGPTASLPTRISSLVRDRA